MCSVIDNEWRAITPIDVGILCRMIKNEMNNKTHTKYLKVSATSSVLVMLLALCWVSPILFEEMLAIFLDGDLQKHAQISIHA